MNLRLRRIPTMTLGITVSMAVGAALIGRIPGTGILIGGLAACLDFVVIRELGSAMLARNVARGHLVPMALAKSFALILVPAMALSLPSDVVDGISFAVGVTALPTAIVADAWLGVPPIRTGDV